MPPNTLHRYEMTEILGILDTKKRSERKRDDLWIIKKGEKKRPNRQRQRDRGRDR